MKKKKKGESIEEYVKGLKVLATLAPEHYWEWRATIEELDHAKSRQIIAELEHQKHELEIEILKERSFRFRKNIIDNSKIVQQAEIECDRIRHELGSKYGVNMIDTVIDPHTYDVKELPEKE